MARSLTASLNTSPAGVPRVKVDVSWGDAPLPSQVRLYRVDPDGTRRVVRQGDPLLVSGSPRIGTAYDYEAPFDLAVTYVAVKEDTGLEVASGSVTSTSGGIPWLIHPGLPELSQPLTVGSWPTWTRAVLRGTFQPIGRKYPVVVSSRRLAESGDLVVYTASTVAHDALLKVLDAGVPLFLKGTSAEGSGTRWVSVGDLVSSPIEDGPGSLVTGFVVHGLPLQVVDSPSGQALAAWTYAQSSSAFTSYADALTKAATYAARTAGV